MLQVGILVWLHFRRTHVFNLGIDSSNSMFELFFEGVASLVLVNNHSWTVGCLNVGH